MLRCCILKQYRQLSYEELAFHLDDSSAFRAFSCLEMGQYPCKSVLQENIKSLTEETWEAIHSRIISYAQREKIETGRKIRIDSTAIETDIHHPTDSTLLCDSIRVITRWLAAGKQLSPPPVYPFSDHESSQETADGYSQHPERDGPTRRVSGATFLFTAGGRLCRSCDSGAPVI